MKRTLFFSTPFSLICVLFLQFSTAQEYTRWSLPEGATLRLGKGTHTDAIAYSPDGTRLAVASRIGIWLYDVHTGAEVALLTGHIAQVSSVTFSPDGKMIASGSFGGIILLWSLASTAADMTR